jgi:uncharacterized LabA/DUF88 family protein/cold shock CspA family protein
MAKTIRVGVFYDGNYFFHVSNYYAYQHPRRSRLNLKGLHAFMRRKIAALEGSDERYCQLVSLHYFRSRLSASEASSRDILFAERTFDDVLIREGITTHYLPINSEGSEKSIEVLMALEAYEQAIHKSFDVVVLVTGDGDYVPLVRKLNTLGARVAVMSWDYEFRDRHDNLRVTRTSQQLTEEATYPILMSDLVEDRARRNDPEIRGLFIERGNAPRVEAEANVEDVEDPAEEPEFRGEIRSLKEGYGFIRHHKFGENLFFWSGEVKNTDFSNLREGDVVAFDIGKNDRGPCAIGVYLKPHGRPDSPDDEFEDDDDYEDDDEFEDDDDYEDDDEFEDDDEQDDKADKPKPKP